MIKKVLLKLAYLISKYYDAIEIGFPCNIKFDGNYYYIKSCSQYRDIFGNDRVNIELEDILSKIQLIKYKGE